MHVLQPFLRLTEAILVNFMKGDRCHPMREWQFFLLSHLFPLSFSIAVALLSWMLQILDGFDPNAWTTSLYEAIFGTLDEPLTEPDTDNELEESEGEKQDGSIKNAMSAENGVGEGSSKMKGTKKKRRGR